MVEAIYGGGFNFALLAKLCFTSRCLCQVCVPSLFSGYGLVFELVEYYSHESYIT